MTSKKIFAAISGILFFAFLQQPVFADNSGSASLQVSPVQQKIEITPGTTYHGIFSVQNVGSSALEYSLSVSPYQVINENYDPDFSTINTYTQIANWITFDYTTGTLEPGTNVDIPYTIDVPADAPESGQYAILMASSNDYARSNSAGANISVVGAVGTILYAHVSGETHESGSLLKNDVDFLSIGSPITATAIVQNSGNIDFETTSTLKITRLLNGYTVYDNSETPSVQNVIPESSRLLINTWEDTPKLGLFKVSQTISFLDQSYTTEKIVFACPVWLIIAVAVIICLVLILAAMTIVSHLHRHHSIKFSSIR